MTLMTKGKGMNEYVFVYGTLKKDFRAHHLIPDEGYMGEYVSNMKFRVFGNSFPMAVLSRDGNQIRGECYWLTSPELKELDRYEGYPGFYTRDKMMFHGFTTGLNVTAWMYHIPVRKINDMVFDHPLEPNSQGLLEWEKGKLEQS